MSRRNLAYAVLVIASLVVSACSQPTAPVSNDTTNNCRGWTSGSGFTCS